MKIKQILAFSLLTISAAFLLHSCGDDPVNPAPGIDFIAEGGSVTTDVSMDGDKVFTIVFQVTDDSKVKTVEITSVVDGRITPQLDTTINAASAKIKITRKSLARIASEVWTIVATDDKGVSTSKSLTITTTTEAGGDILTSYEVDNNNETFKVWNINSPSAYAGAFNLLDGSPQFSGDPAAEKDIHDSCTLQEINNWPGRWTSKNGTVFKKVTSYSYTDIKNTGQLDAAWNASGNSNKWMVLAKDDLYLAKLRGTNDKVLVLITNVVKTTALGDNKDYVQFKFKKK